MSDKVLSGRRLLVVEDDYFWADELARALRRAGATILGPAASIAAAQSLLTSRADMDGAILDINLRGERAYSIVDRLIRWGVPLLITTGYDLEALPDTYAKLPRLEKPITVDMLIRAAESLFLPV